MVLMGPFPQGWRPPCVASVCPKKVWSALVLGWLALRKSLVASSIVPAFAECGNVQRLAHWFYVHAFPNSPSRSQGRSLGLLVGVVWSQALTSRGAPGLWVKPPPCPQGMSCAKHGPRPAAWMSLSVTEWKQRLWVLWTRGSIAQRRLLQLLGTAAGGPAKGSGESGGRWGGPKAGSEEATAT